MRGVMIPIVVVLGMAGGVWLHIVIDPYIIELFSHSLK